VKVMGIVIRAIARLLCKRRRRQCSLVPGMIYVSGMDQQVGLVEGWVFQPRPGRTHLVVLTRHGQGSRWLRAGMVSAS
jgi:hypothetical protein